MSYINGILEWGEIPHKKVFSVGRKGAVGVDNLPDQMNDENAKELLQSLITEFKDVTLFQGKSKVVDTEKCVQAPPSYKCRGFERKYCERLKASIFGHSALTLEKKIIFLVPVLYESSRLGEVGYYGTPFSEKPRR